MKHSIEIDAHVARLKMERAQYIEIFSAAFIKEVGEAKASKYKLVETVIHKSRKMTTTWKFELR